jgi:hypothetical protein
MRNKSCSSGFYKYYCTLKTGSGQRDKCVESIYKEIKEYYVLTEKKSERKR